MRKHMSTDMAKIYNSHNFIPREMVTLLSGRFFYLPAWENFIIFIPKPVLKCPKMLYTGIYSVAPDSTACNVPEFAQTKGND